ncbi:amidohydrolase family protein [Bacteroidota bacterium]
MRIRRILLGCLTGILFPLISGAQENFPVNGVKDKRLDVHAFTNAKIIIDYQTSIENAILVIRDGIIEAVGSSITVPEEAVIHDMEGKFIYPGLIDIYTNYGMPGVKAGLKGRSMNPQYKSSREGPYGWNEAIKSDFDAVMHFKENDKMAEKLRKEGFSVVQTFRPDGIVRGSATLVSLGKGPEQELILNEFSAAQYSFQKGSSKQAYPNSIMGAVALLRQTYYDAAWYKSPLNRKQNNQSLQAFNDLQNLPQIIEVTTKERLLLADKVGDEFGKQYIIKGNGDEYQRINEIKKTGASLIVPLNFPEVYNVEDPFDALIISLKDMKHWELAPANPGILTNQGIQIALTTKGLKNTEDFWPNLKKAVKRGLDKHQAIKALTQTPAQLMRAENRLGSLQRGKTANFLVTSGDLFEDDTKILSNWIQGSEYVINKPDLSDMTGIYELIVNGEKQDFEISGKPGDYKYSIKVNDSTEIKVEIKIDTRKVTLKYKPEKEKEGKVMLSGWMTDRIMKGEGQLADGTWISWSLSYVGELEEKQDDKKDEGEKEEKEKEKKEEKFGPVIYPFMAFGWSEKPKQEGILFRNATVWTNETEGILQQTDVLIEGGKIKAIGNNLDAGNAEVIDASNKHLTSGIIDEHSHIALTGVNEGSQSVTSEVRMEDALTSENIHIYRQLAGGVTATHLLHGSANTVGGQSVVIKLRWGDSPQDMMIDGVDQFLKFALGENVKQSNWGGAVTTRFPQTRMGVEQVLIDAFTRASEYNAEWERYNTLPKKQKIVTPKPRVDLELEALADILNKESYIACHAYIQSEIVMMMTVAEQFGVNVNTFIHIMEGYKVADMMAEHGVSGSTFSDWWAYKNEVRDAIPYNAVLMEQAGVLTCINSDDAEMARRLNQESAKAVKYGGMSEENAWKLVTLNPAKILHLDDRMGSIKVGKDADLVLWSDHPMSIYAKAEKTLVDGRVYFDQGKDMEARNWMEEEKARLITKMEEISKENGKGKKGMPQKYRDWDDMDIQVVYY